MNYDTIRIPEEYKDWAKDLERVITYYCKYKETQYQQGFHEIVFIFIYICQPKPDPNIILPMLDSFIERFLKLANVSEDVMDDIITYINMLLQYHDPGIPNHSSQ